MIEDNLKPSILIVDDEISIREAFYLILQDKYNLDSASSGEAAVKKIVDKKADLVFLDIRMPGIDGIETLKKIKAIDEEVEVVMVTAVNDVQKAGEAIKIGAYDYILKPFDVEEILDITKKLAGKKLLKLETKSIRENAKSNVEYPEMSGFSDYIKNLLQKIDDFSQTDACVLLIGEIGTEKDTLALQIHNKSNRKEHPFRQICVSEYSDMDINEKLFGEGKGASLHFLEKDSGLIEEANGGTLLINNIDSASLEFQQTLLDMIKTKEAKRIGSDSVTEINIRFMVSSTKDIKMLVDENKFNKELYDIISACVATIVPLRERKEDISSIIASIIETKKNTAIKIDPLALGLLEQYPWPGNTKEIKNLIKRFALTCKSEMITVQDLPIDFIINSRTISLSELSQSFEKQFISSIIKRYNIDLQKASVVLNIKKSLLLSKIDELNIGVN